MCRALLSKDLCHLRSSLLPALLLNLPLVVILHWIAGPTQTQPLSWMAVYTICFFISSVQLLYRSFGLEHRYRTFIVYSSLQVPKQSVFWSQTMAQFLGLLILASANLGLVMLFWSPSEIPYAQWLILSLCASAAIAPMGSLLGLLLQIEREFLFSLFFLPYMTPVVLASYALLQDTNSASWWKLLGLFCILGAFFSALVFEFFFDEVTELD